MQSRGKARRTICLGVLEGHKAPSIMNPHSEASFIWQPRNNFVHYTLYIPDNTLLLVQTLTATLGAAIIEDIT